MSRCLILHYMASSTEQVFRRSSASGKGAHIREDSVVLVSYVYSETVKARMEA